MAFSHRPLAGVMLLLLLTTGQIHAQESQYRARLSPMPNSLASIDEITGVGEVVFTLSGNSITADGHFEGMSSAATMVHLHLGPPAQPGPVALSLQFTGGVAGTISGSVELTEAQLEALNTASLYVQVHSENNPAGELRGWIFLQSG